MRPSSGTSDREVGRRRSRRCKVLGRHDAAPCGRFTLLPKGRSQPKNYAESNTNGTHCNLASRDSTRHSSAFGINGKAQWLESGSLSQGYSDQNCRGAHHQSHRRTGALAYDPSCRYLIVIADLSANFEQTPSVATEYVISALGADLLGRDRL